MRYSPITIEIPEGFTREEFLQLSTSLETVKKQFPGVFLNMQQTREQLLQALATPEETAAREARNLALDEIQDQQTDDAENQGRRRPRHY